MISSSGRGAATFPDIGVAVVGVPVVLDLVGRTSRDVLGDFGPPNGKYKNMGYKNYGDLIREIECYGCKEAFSQTHDGRELRQ